MKITHSFSVNNPERYSGELQDEVYHQSIFAAQQAYQQEKVERNHEPLSKQEKLEKIIRRIKARN